MFYGPISHEENQRLRPPIRPRREFDFRIVRNNFNEWLRVWKMTVPGGYGYKADLLRFAQNTKNRFIDVCEYEFRGLRSIKIQFGLIVKFSMTRNEETQQMEHYFNRMQSVIINRNNIETLDDVFNRFIDGVRGEIEAWSQRGSGWVLERILEAFINVTKYQPFRRGSCMPLPEKLQNKKAIIYVQNRDNQCLRWALRAALFPPQRGVKVTRTRSYPAEDVLDFTGIDSPAPVSQINKLEKQNSNLAINVFSWEKGQVIVHRISE